MENDCTANMELSNEKLSVKVITKELVPAASVLPKISAINTNTIASTGQANSMPFLKSWRMVNRIIDPEMFLIQSD